MKVFLTFLSTLMFFHFLLCQCTGVGITVTTKGTSSSTTPNTIKQFAPAGVTICSVYAKIVNLKLLTSTLWIASQALVAQVTETVEIRCLRIQTRFAKRCHWGGFLVDIPMDP